MSRVVAFAEAREIKREGRRRLPLMDSSFDTPDLPYAFLTRQEPGRVIGTHFHSSDQWQFILDGKGTLGHDKIGPCSVHFSKAYTPYGPLVSASDAALSNLVLYSHYQPGAKYLPENMSVLKAVKNRRPWQTKGQLHFPSLEGREVSVGFELQEVAGLRNDEGMFVCTLAMAPNIQAVAPDASKGGGQYLVVYKGSMIHGGKEYEAPSLAYVAPTDASFQVCSGPTGAEIAILNFPRQTVQVTEQSMPTMAAATKRWECELCGFVYDEALGLPDEGIPPGTKWEDVPESWSCPDCAAMKDDFVMVEVK